MSKTKLLYLVNVDWFFVSHRLPIAIAALENGYEVHVATTITDKKDFLTDAGFTVHDVAISRGSSGIFSTLRTIKDIVKIFKIVKPNIVHLVTIKPILLGGIASRVANIKAVIAAISGLGFVFIDTGLKAFFRRAVVNILYKISLGHKNLKVICQNLTDLKEIQKITNLPDISFSIIDGSGVSLEKFNFSPDTNKIPLVIMASRMLKDKGVVEFAEAAKMLHAAKIKARFILVGAPDPDNPSSISMLQIKDWEQKEILEYWGHKDNMNEIFGLASLVVLPSYREGFPKVLIEAAASGRAVVTTDVPGCRDAIYNGITGMLVPAQDSNALADAIKELIINRETCHNMGKEGRKMAEKRFDENIVIEKHLSLYNQILSKVSKV